MSWLDGWQYRKRHVINPQTGAGTGYQVKVKAFYGSESPLITSVFRFTKVSDATDLYFLEPMGITNVRFGAGGLKLKSGGSWASLLWYSKPSPVATVRSGHAIPYNTGLCYYYGDNSQQVIVQMDNSPFILIRSVLGTVTCPLIDGWDYATNGNVNGSNVELEVNEYVVFYPSGGSAPSLGTYWTSSIESGSGFMIHMFHTDGVTDMPFYLNFGSSHEGRVLAKFDVYNRLTSSLPAVKFPSTGNYKPPAIPIFGSNWRERNDTWIVPLILSAYWGSIDVPYMNDPNAGTFKTGGLVTEINYIPSYDTNYWGVSWEEQVHDTSLAYRLIVKGAILYYYNSDIWKMQKYFRLELKSSVYNYDQLGLTRGLGLLDHTGITDEAGYGYNTSYSDYISSWATKNFVADNYTWVTGAKATRTTVNYNGVTHYIYVRYLGKPQDSVTYKYARHNTHPTLSHYFTLWCDVWMQQPLKMAVEEWYAESDQYEETPTDPTTLDDSVYEQFFSPILNIVYLNSHSRTDFGDIRFTDDDKESELNYWLEEKVDSDYAIFWVAVADSLESNPADIYIYYGKVDATTTSNFNNTFPLNPNDYFDDQTVDTTPIGWSTPAAGTFLVASDQVKHGTKSAEHINSSGENISRKTQDAVSAVSVIWWIRKADNDVSSQKLYARDGTTEGFAVGLLNNGQICYYRSGWQNLQVYNANTWYKIELNNFNWTARSFDIYIDDILVKSGALMVTTTSGSHIDDITESIYLAGDVWLDSIIIRKYVSPEPEHREWYEEESLTKIQTISGNIYLKSVMSEVIIGNINIKTTITEGILGNVQLKDVITKTILGNIILKDVLVETIVGNITLKDTMVKTILGNVSLKVILTKTILGDITLKDTMVKTILGNVNIVGIIAALGGESILIKKPRIIPYIVRDILLREIKSDIKKAEQEELVRIKSLIAVEQQFSIKVSGDLKVKRESRILSIQSPIIIKKNIALPIRASIIIRKYGEEIVSLKAKLKSFGESIRKLKDFKDKLRRI